MDLGLKDRVAIVTGGNRGIGYAISAELLKEGAHVVVASLDPARNAQGDREAEGPIERPRDRHADRPQRRGGGRSAVQEDARRIRPPRHPGQQRHQRLAGQLLRDDEEHWDHAFDNKLRGTVRCIRHAVPPMRERKWGRIINISGGAAWTPQLGAITTGINNAAVQNLTVALANELGKDGILVNAIVPTAVRTDRHDKNIRDTMAKTGQSEAEVLKPRVAKIPLGRMATAEEIAAVVAFLASERASFVTGSAWAVDGGVSARL